MQIANLDSHAWWVYSHRDMIFRKIRTFHAIVALVLFYCVLCPFVEIALHSNNCIFVSGHDTESTVALLLLIVELAFALGTLSMVVVPHVLIKTLTLISSNRLTLSSMSFVFVMPEISPPLPLRI